ncbi:hypothetical protein [Dysgonomonas sp. ZJ279]|uniref:hypothetical protein n=1 Tax=Dysgonomonas sp. ZJ279 TaxID=2709796 RepID=UPI0013EB2C5F|nr:hypothetical protein [Dysgonomonas sp. ZJ279]
MLNKRNIKIVILLILMLIVIVCGWHMYQRLNQNKQFFDTDIYTCISPQAQKVIHISRNHSFDKLYQYNAGLKAIIEPLKEYISYPIIIYGDKTDKILLMKLSKEQEIDIKNILETKIISAHPPKEIRYKDSILLLYSTSDNQFLVCTYHKGILALSKNYKLVTDFIDIDPQNTFFTNYEDDNTIYKLKKKSPISLFIKENDNLFALDYTTDNDTIKLNGYLFNYKQDIDPDIPYKLLLPDSLCIEQIQIADTNSIKTIKMILNKNL